MPKTCLALLMCAAGAFAAGKPWTPDDLWNRRTISDPWISPDGQQVVYLESWNDRATDRACANVRLVGVANRQTRSLTEGAWRDSSPRWSPDSTRIAWISGRGGIHIWTLASAKESVLDVASLSFAWSADGANIAYTARTQSSNAPAPWAPAAILPWLWPKPAEHVILYVIPAAGGPAQAISAAGVDVTGEPAWVPDGKSILITGADGEIYSIRLSDKSSRRLIQEPGRKENPLPSPDGSKIAWMSTDPRPFSYSVRKLYVMNADGTRMKALAGALDRDPAHPRWSADSRTIYFTADDAGATYVYASRADSTLRQVTKTADRLRDFSLAENGRAVTARSTAQQSGELISFTVDLPSSPVVLAAPMAKLMAERDTGAVEEIHFPSAGKSIQGWLIKPPHFDPDRKYPLLLEIADAPRRMYGPELSLRAQIVAARGWVVLRINPRGTPGYGEEFGRLLPTRYPGDDAEDLLAGVEFIAAKDYIDTKRMAVSGGLLTAWILGHSDRFALAIARRPIVDFAWDSRSLSWMGAMPWDDPDQYVKHSPIYFAQNWKTPTLVIAGTPDPQADEFYTALQQRRVNSALLRLPDDKPSTQILEWEAILAWLQ